MDGGIGFQKGEESVAGRAIMVAIVLAIVFGQDGAPIVIEVSGVLQRVSLRRLASSEPFKQSSRRRIHGTIDCTALG